jgi:hypothetical protein
MPKKIKQSRRNSTITSARDYVLRAFDQAVGFLDERERALFIPLLRADLFKRRDISKIQPWPSWMSKLHAQRTAP